MVGNTERRNDNPTPSMTAKSNASDNADVILWADPATHRLLVNASVAISGGSLTNNNAAPTNTNLGVLPAVANASAPVWTEGFQVLLSTDLNGNLRTVFGGSLPAGTNVIGHVIVDSGTITTVSTVTAVATVSTVTAVTTVATVTNLAQMNGAALLMGNGVTGTGSQRVTVASDNSAVALWGHGATAASIPANAVLHGGRGSTANPTAVTDGQMVATLHDKLGKMVVVGSVRDLKVNQITTITASASETTILTAVASTFLDIYGIIITNTSATAVTVAIKDSTSGTTQFNIAVPAGDTRGFMLPEGGAIKQGTVNNNWTATTQSVSSVIITVFAVKNI